LTIHALGGDLNPYAYVHGHVTTATDPLGLDETSSNGSDSPPIDVWVHPCDGPCDQANNNVPPSAYTSVDVAPPPGTGLPGPAYSPGHGPPLGWQGGSWQYSGGQWTSYPGLIPSRPAPAPDPPSAVQVALVAILDAIDRSFHPPPGTQIGIILPLGAIGAGLDAAEGLASNAANAPRLAMDLAAQEAKSAFTATGELSPEAIQGATRIFAPGELGNPAIPEGFGKYTTETFQSPSGPFQAHFYMNAETGETFYGLDYKAIFNGNGGPTYFQPFSGSAP